MKTKSLFLFALSLAFGITVQAQSVLSKKPAQTTANLVTASPMQPLSLLKPFIAAPPTNGCPDCVLQIVRRSADIWDIRVSGYMDIQYFTQNSIAIMESPKLTLYSSSGAIIDVIALSEERVEYRSSWENGHPVSGSGAVNRQPVSASITWKATYASGRVSSVTEQIPIR